MSHKWLSFNETHSNGDFGLKDEDEEEVQALRQTMYLKDTWVLWEQVVANDGKQSKYADATRQVCKFSTVQEFWAIWNALPQPSELLESRRIMREPSTGSGSPVAIDAIMIFRDGIHPSWEDKHNANGGHYQIQLKPNIGGGQIDEYWNNIVLAMIGGYIEQYDLITGIRLVDKLSGPKGQTSIRVELWFQKSPDSNAPVVLKRSMEKIMGTKLDGTERKDFNPEFKVEMKSHVNAGKH